MKKYTIVSNSIKDPGLKVAKKLKKQMLQVEPEVEIGLFEMDDYGSSKSAKCFGVYRTFKKTCWNCI